MREGMSKSCEKLTVLNFVNRWMLRAVEWQHIDEHFSSLHVEATVAKCIDKFYDDVIKIMLKSHENRMNHF